MVHALVVGPHVVTTVVVEVALVAQTHVRHGERLPPMEGGEVRRRRVEVAEPPVEVVMGMGAAEVTWPWVMSHAG